MKIDFNKEMEEIIKNLNGVKKKLLIHSCCAPCNSHVLTSLSEFFDITIYFYNPNINIPGEFEKRYEEQKRFIEETHSNTQLIRGEFNPKDFLEAIKGLEKLGEGTERCTKCFELRIANAAKKAKELGVDYFTTSLTISPMKDANELNEIGNRYGAFYNIQWLPSDFKKKGGYQNSIKLSKEYSLYRQNYCGCSFSMAESMERNKNNSTLLKQNNNVI